MISERHFDEFVAPYYRQLVPRLQELGATVIVDTDGDVTRLVPWLLREGIHGVLPLERQAGVDGMKLRQQFPTLGMIGHYDKMVMSRGEAAMRGRVRAAHAADAERRVHSQRRPPDAAGRVARAVPLLPSAAGRVHRHWERGLNLTISFPSSAWEQTSAEYAGWAPPSKTQGIVVGDAHPTARAHS